ncbi:hypothetical protein D3C77_467200 [compost metagenome]
MKIQIRQWLLRILVFGSIWRIVSYVILDLFLNSFTVPNPYDIPVGLVALAIVLIISLILTTALVDGHKLFQDKP